MRVLYCDMAHDQVTVIGCVLCTYYPPAAASFLPECLATLMGRDVTKDSVYAHFN